MSQSAARLVDILERVARSPEPLGLMEIAEQTGLDKSTASRLLGLMHERQLVTRDAVTRRYTVGPAFLSLAAFALQGSDIRRLARPYLERIRDLTGETVSLHLRVGSERVCVDGVESPHVVRRVLPLGQQIPLHSGPSGKVILAFLPEREVAKITRSAHLVADARTALGNQLAETRRLGYLAAIGDRTAGVGAISVPLFDAQGPTASITVAGPAERWNLERLHEHAPTLSEMASQISAALGGPRP